MGATGVQWPVAGSYRSADCRVVTVFGPPPPGTIRPPLTSTRPSGSSAAAWASRGDPIAPAALQRFVAGSKRSAVARVVSPAPCSPPTTSTVPSDSAVAVQPSRGTDSAGAGVQVGAAARTVAVTGARVATVAPAPGVAVAPGMVGVAADAPGVPILVLGAMLPAPAGEVGGAGAAGVPQAASITARTSARTGNCRMPAPSPLRAALSGARRRGVMPVQRPGRADSHARQPGMPG